MPKEFVRAKADKLLASLKDHPLDSPHPVPAARSTPRADLGRLLSPRGIAVGGVSNDASRIGGQALKLLTDFGYSGIIYPVNPKYGEIKGLACYPDVTSVPRPCDVALIAHGYQDNFDINPLFVCAAGKGVAAADALIVLKDQQRPQKPL